MVTTTKFDTPSRLRQPPHSVDHTPDPIIGREPFRGHCPPEVVDAPSSQSPAAVLTSVVGCESERGETGKVLEGNLHLCGALGADLLFAQLTADAPREQAEAGLHAQEADLGEDIIKKAI